MNSTEAAAVAALANRWAAAMTSMSILYLPVALLLAMRGSTRRTIIETHHAEAHS